MVGGPEVFYLLVNHPTPIAIPIVIFATLALWSRSSTAWLAPAPWTQHPVYELGMKTEEFCSGTACLKRSPFYEIYPLLAILSLVVALLQCMCTFPTSRCARLCTNDHDTRRSS